MTTAGTNTPRKPFTLNPNEDATGLVLCVTGPVAKAAALEADILTAARAFKLTVPIDEAAVKAAVAGAAGSKRTQVLIARGTKPVHGADCHFQWVAKISERVEKGGRLSHYLGRIEKRVVKAGDPIGRVVREAAGVDGSDMFGKPLKAKAGRPAVIKPGANVREKEGIFFSEKDGLVRESKGKIQVDEVMIVDSNLDFETGNVDFTGSVIVKGGILDLFTVKAGGAIQVGGLVEAATLIAAGDVEVKGGIAGKKKGVIRAGGSVTAKFLLNAEVYAEGDVIVETQAITSRVMTLRSLKVPKGPIAGGEATALAGIFADTIGSDSAVTTTVTAGLSYSLDNTLAEIDAETKKLQKRLAAIDKELAEMKGKNLTHAAREKMTELTMEKSEAEEAFASLETRRNDAVTSSHKAAVPVILVRKLIYPGVTIRLGDCKLVTDRPVTGPVKIVVDRTTGTIRFLAGSAD